MDVDMVLRINGIDGESKPKGHVKEIDLQAWSWGAAKSGIGAEDRLTEPFGKRGESGSSVARKAAR